MKEVVYDVPINEVAEILRKSDRQVRRYVREKRLGVRPVRVNGRVKLMFSREEVETFGRNLESSDPASGGHRVVVDARLIDGPADKAEQAEDAVVDSHDASTADAVKYAIDVLREEIRELRKQNEELHYQLEQRSGQVGFLQSKVEMMQDDMKMLMPSPESQDEIIERKPWYRRIFGRG